MQLRHPRGAQHVVHRRLFAPVGDVFAQARAEQKDVLLNHPDVVAQRLERYIAYVNAVNGDAPAVHLVKARQQVGDSAFAAAGRAEQRHDLALLYIKIDAAQHGLVGFVAKAHILKAHVALDARQFARVRLFADFGLRVQYLKQALPARRRPRV